MTEGFVESSSSSSSSVQLRIYFASQTGTAREYAERFAREASWRGFDVLLLSFEEFTARHCTASATATHSESLGGRSSALFFVSTTGDGEFPDHALPAWRALLSRGLSSTVLSGLRFSVFGLGDSSYAKFNAAARKLCTRLLQLGGALFYDRGLGDEGSTFGLAGDYDVWEKGAWLALSAEYPQVVSPPGADFDRNSRIPACRFTTRCISAAASSVPAAATAAAASGSPQCIHSELREAATNAPAGVVLPPYAWPLPFGVPAGVYPPHCCCATPAIPQTLGAPAEATRPYLARVLENRRLTAPTWTQDVRHIELDISGYFDPGSSDDGEPAASAASSFQQERRLHGDTGTKPSRGNTLATPTPSLQQSTEATRTDGASTIEQQQQQQQQQLPQQLGFLPGDIAVVYPDNTGDGGEEVRALAERLNAHLDDVIIIDDDTTAAGPAQCLCTACSSGSLSIRYSTAAPPPASNSVCPFSIPPRVLQFATLAHLSPSPRLPLHTPVTVGYLLRNVLDILGTPRRSFFAALVPFAGDDDEARARLAEMASADGADLYATYCVRERRSYAEVLRDFPSVTLPFPFLLELVPPLQPRQFSIASSFVAARGRLSLCVAVVDYKTPWGRRRRGTASSWLATRRSVAVNACEGGAAAATPIASTIAASDPSTVVPLLIRRGVFRLPTARPCPPLLLIGPGTGVAPMRAIIQELSVGGREGRGGPVHLYFGCRHAASDWLYREEFQDAVTTAAAAAPACFEATAGASPPRPPHLAEVVVELGGAIAAVLDDAAPAAASNGSRATAAAVLENYQVAFSRDSLPKVVYVQGLLLHRSAEVFRLLTQEDAIVFISGSAKRMPSDVVGVLTSILEQEGGASVDEAAAFLANMGRTGRLTIEAWS